MAAATGTFNLTTASYQDISLGHFSCFFVVPFNRNLNTAIRVVLATVQPSAGATSYELIDPQALGLAEGSQNQDIPRQFLGLSSADRVWARGHVNTVAITAHDI